MTRWFMSPGVYLDYLNGLQCYGDSTGKQVKIKTGAGWAYGAFFLNDAEYVLGPIADNTSGNPRIDRVVVRFDWTLNTAAITLLVGTPAASPVPPSVANSPGVVWDLQLAQVAVAAGFVTITAGNVTDERANAVPRVHDLLSTHTISGQGTGYPLRTTSATAFSFGQIGDLALDGTAQRRNELVNGGFETKTRAVSSASTTGAPFHDGWDLAIAVGESLTVQDSTSVVMADSQHAALCTATSTGNGGTIYSQNLRVAPSGGGTGGFHYFRGKALSLLGWVKQQGATANAVRLFLATDGTGGGTTFSSYHGANTNWEALTCANRIVPNDATVVTIGAQFMAGTALDILLDDLMLVQGATPTNYLGDAEAINALRCAARVQLLPRSGSLNFSGYNAASWAYTVPIPLAAIMTKTPTVTIATAFSNTNCNAPTVTALDRSTLQVSIVQNTASPAAWQAVSGVVLLEASPS